MDVVATRMWRVFSQILEAELMPECFRRPADFDLETFWLGWCNEYELQSPSGKGAKFRLKRCPCSRAYVGERARGQITQSHMPDTEGWVTLDLPFELFITARTRLLGISCAVEVLEPESLRKNVLLISQNKLWNFIKRCSDTISYFANL